MSITKDQAVKALSRSEALFVAYSAATRLPYVICDEESFNDQAWIFSTEEGVKEFGKKKLENKELLMGMKYDRKNFGQLYGTLYAIGVNSIVWNDNGESCEVDITAVAKQADHSKLEPNRRPLLNPTLQLSAIYFLQEMKRPVPMEEHVDIKAKEEELIANLVKSEFLIAMNVDPSDPKKISVPFLKNKDGKALQPFFSDIIEFQKFAKGKKEIRAAKVPFSKVKDMMVKDVEAMVMDPMSLNMIFDKKQLDLISNIRG